MQVFAPPSKERLRHTLLHWLACRELGYTQLVDTLPGDQQHSSKEVEEVRGGVGWERCGKVCGKCGVGPRVRYHAWQRQAKSRCALLVAHNVKHVGSRLWKQPLLTSSR